VQTNRAGFFCATAFGVLHIRGVQRRDQIGEEKVMAAASGQYGQILVSGSTLVECTEWTMTEEVAEHTYASCSTSGWRRRVAGTKDTTGSCGGIFDPADPIHDYVTVGSAVTLLLYFATAKYHSVPAMITSIETNVNIEEGEIIRWTINWGGNGASSLNQSA